MLGRPSLTWGKPALSGHSISGGAFLPSVNTMGPGSYKKTVILNLAEISASVSRNELVEVIKAKFSPAKVISVQFVPVKRVQVTFEDPK